MKMEEVKHVWSTLRSVTKSGNNAHQQHQQQQSNSNSNGSNKAVNSTAVWYDVPAPVIIHCHEFRQDEIERDECAEVKVTNAMDQDRVYENNAEVERTNSTGDTSARSSPGPQIRRHSEAGSESNSTKKHRNTVELTAVTTVETNEEGIPTISFSFLQSDEKSRKIDCDEVEEVTGNVEVDEPRQDQLYDFPKKSYVHEETEAEKVVESCPERSNDKDIKEETVPATTPCDPDDSKDSSEDVLEITEQQSPEDITDKCITHSKTDLTNVKNRRDRGKRSVRSLKSGRRSYGISESEGYDPGIASMSGSYSDPECPSEGFSHFTLNGSRTKFQKRRLGKAWDKMRTWLRDETHKINEVVNKHARLQAVGALSGEGQKIPKSKCGSYDLTKARTQELGSITRVEEFGLSRVSEEICDVVALSNSNPEENGAAAPGESVLVVRKTASTDSVFNEEVARSKCPPVSFSMDRLCSDTEENEEVDAATGENREHHSRKGGLIKRRMLGSIRGLMASTHLLHIHENEEGGQSGFEDVRRYVKQGGDFCKELAAILHERAELEATYAKGLSKLSNKLTKACAKDQGGNSGGGVNEAWRCVGEEMEAAAEAHRVWGIALTEQLAKPLRVGVAEAQGRSRKTIENSVDKAGKSLQEWRGVAAKSKKQSFACARENERLQDLARLQTISQTQQANNKASNHHLTDKEASKLEARRRKAEDSSRRADTEFYTVSVRAERARLEYESTVRKGGKQMELLEEERLSALKDLANVYLAHLQALAPRLQQSADRLSTPIRNCNVSQDVEILKNLIRRIDNNDTCNAEQLLPDFYAEHVTLAMNRERRKQSLVRVLHLIRQDLVRERRGREGLETLHRAFIKTPAFAADESTQNVTDKLHHMRSMLLYLEAARYKVGGTLAEVEGSKRGKHPLAEHILVSRDKQGLQQSVLKVPSWAKNESFEIPEGEDELDVHLGKDHETESRHWADRTAGDGNSENPPDEDDFSDFDEFSSHSEDNNNQDLDAAETASKSERSEQCRAIYQYSANLNDELSLNPGDLITVHQKQPDGWWIGECRGRTGIFPATYVQVIH